MGPNPPFYEQIYHFGRGICEKYQSRDEKFPEPKDDGNLVNAINQIWNPEVFRIKRYNFFSLCRGICENVFHFFTLTCRKPPNSFGILQPLSNKTNRNYQSRDEKFPEPKDDGNLVSRLVFFANTPPKHDISV
jgi:hypothetical protein